jgi:hypothetical protein
MHRRSSSAYHALLQASGGVQPFTSTPHLPPMVPAPAGHNAFSAAACSEPSREGLLQVLSTVLANLQAEVLALKQRVAQQDAQPQHQLQPQPQPQPPPQQPDRLTVIVRMETRGVATKDWTTLDFQLTADADGSVDFTALLGLVWTTLQPIVLVMCCTLMPACTQCNACLWS